MDLLTLGIGILIGIVVGGAIAWGFFAKKLATAKPAGEIADAINQLEERVPEILARQREEDNVRVSDQWVKRTKDFADAHTTINKHLERIEQMRTEAYGELKTKTRDLSVQTGELNKMLSNTSARGAWGEFQLKKLVGYSGLVEGIHYDFNKAILGGGKPDMVIKLPNDAKIIIDSKVPLTNYMKAMKELEKRDEHLNAFIMNIKDTIDKLAKRQYPEKLQDSAPFTIMYIEIESAFACAIEYDAKQRLKDEKKTITEFALDKNVLIASPITLLALLKSTAYGFDWKDTYESVKEIQSEVNKLFEAAISLIEHFDNVGKGLNDAVRAHNASIGSLNSNFLSKLKKMTHLRKARSDFDFESRDELEELAGGYRITSIKGEKTKL